MEAGHPGRTSVPMAAARSGEGWRVRRQELGFGGKNEPKGGSRW